MSKTSRLTRRNLLAAGLGAAQMSLLGSLALNAGAPRRASAGPETGPTKLITLFLTGGWIPTSFFVPLSDEEIGRYCLPGNPGDYRNDPTHYRADQVQNLDGSGRAMDGPYQRIRVPVLWDAASMSAGMNNATPPYSPWGWSWVQHRLWENACIAHGIDQGTASHASGIISAMCGLPGSRYRWPALHARAGNWFYDRFGDDRPLPVVSVGDSIRSPTLDHLDLPAHAAPTRALNTASLIPTMSDRLDSAWTGLRARSERAQLDFAGNPAGMLVTNEMDEYTRAETRLLRGTTNARTDAFYQQLYDNYGGFSRRLALDVISTVEATPGFEHTTPAFWRGSDTWTPWGAAILAGSGADAGQTWNDSFDLALRLLKSDLASAVSVGVPAMGGAFWDSHGDGFGFQSVQVRVAMDIVGRLLGEMKATPIGGGRTLLDDTLVLVLSDFGRTWPNSQKCDHWPVTSVVFAGGGVAPNRMVGHYDWEGLSADTLGPNAGAHPIVNEEGGMETRPLQSADVIYTALHQLGVTGEALFSPGAPGDIVGVRP